MLDIGFSELVVIGVVALVVLGPERLPKVARTVGHLLGRAQRYVNQVKSDLNRELELDELRKLQSQVIRSARELESSVQQEINSARSAFDDVSKALTDSVADSANSTAAESPYDTAASYVSPYTDSPHPADAEIQEQAATAALLFDTEVSCPIDQTRPVA